MNRMPADIARNKWRSLLPELGVKAGFLTGKHGPCPMCGGIDRFRFDDKDGAGTYFCNSCGAGDGFKLVMGAKGQTFAEVVARVRELAGEMPEGKAKPPRDEARCLAAARSLWTSSSPIVGTMAEAYLRSRGCWSDDLAVADALRFVERCRAPGDDARYMPAMIARVSDQSGASINVHRTFLEAGRRAHRAMMPGAVPAGAAIRLGLPAARIGVAEGIETALRAGARFGVTTWATVTAGGLERWEPPSEAARIDIFGDHDRSFTGQAASFALAKRLTNRKVPVACDVHIPGFAINAAATGSDWADDRSEIAA